MKIVLDSNIIFSALIKDSLTRKLILNSAMKFLFPEFILEEIEKHKELIENKSGLTKTELEELLKIIFKRVEIVSNKTIIKYKSEAEKIISKIDSDDVIFFACSLAYDKAVIWSDDKKLKEQKVVKIISTKEFLVITDN